MADPVHRQTGKMRTEAGPEITLKEIHKPSSFEGALWVAQGISDARVIYHAPPGCYLMQHMNSICNEWHPEMYSTLISYAEVMQGTGTKLEEVLKKAAAEKPHAIIIVTSPVVEITGDDVEGAVEAVGLDNTIIVRPPLGGSLADGREKAFIALTGLMNKAAAKQKRTVKRSEEESEARSPDRSHRAVPP